MGIFAGKKGLICGVENELSHAWSIAEYIVREGGECGLTFRPDSPEDTGQRNRRRVTRFQEAFPKQTRFLVPLNPLSDNSLASVMTEARAEFRTIDFLLHHLSFARLDDFKRPTIETSRAGFQLAMEWSVFSFLAIVQAVRPLLNPGASILALSNFAAEKVIPGYNLMAPCKAALNACVKYAAFDLGPLDVRVNALSPGLLGGILDSRGEYPSLMDVAQDIAPGGKLVTCEHVARCGGFLLSPLSEGITAEIMHVDYGYNAMGSPGRMLEQIKAAKA